MVHELKKGVTKEVNDAKHIPESELQDTPVLIPDTKASKRMKDSSQNSVEKNQIYYLFA